MTDAEEIFRKRKKKRKEVFIQKRHNENNGHVGRLVEVNTWRAPPRTGEKTTRHDIK